MLVEKKRIFNLIIHVKDGSEIRKFSVGPYDTSKKEAIADLMKNGAHVKMGAFATQEFYYPPHMIVKMEIKDGWQEGDTVWND